MTGDDPLPLAQLKQFQLGHLIAQGGMASVYYGWDERLDRPVAIKVVDARQQANQSYVKRLVREARAVARWRHEHIVQIYSADAQQGLYYFVMEYIDGLDLARLLFHYAQEGRLMPHDDVLRIGRAVASGLDYAHEHGIIHRDVKPSNVMVAGDGRIVLADFGLALDVRQGTVGEVFGTPQYMSPEQALDSARAVPQSDLYSLGIMLYEMLTGAVPFDDPSPVSLALQHVNQPPPLPADLNPALSVAAEAVLLKALGKAPEERFQTGAELIHALEAALHPPSPLLAPPEGGRPLSEVTVATRVAAHLAARTAPSATAARPPHAPPAPRRASAHRLPPGLTRARLAAGLVIGGGLIGLASVAAVVLLAGPPGHDTPAADMPPTSTVAPVAVETATLIPTAIPSATDTPPPPITNLTTATATPTATPTLTPVPPSETPVLPPTATVLYPDGYRIVLSYYPDAFYLWNPGSTNIEVAGLAFEALDAATGQPTAYRFGGEQWAAYYYEVRRGHCDGIEIVGRPAFARPAGCAGFNAVRTPPETSEWLFWVPRQGITQFRVLLDGQEIARCEISAGVCELRLP